jgi:hypothetical protein
VKLGPAASPPPPSPPPPPPTLFSLVARRMRAPPPTPPRTPPSRTGRDGWCRRLHAGRVGYEAKCRSWTRARERTSPKFRSWTWGAEERERAALFKRFVGVASRIFGASPARGSLLTTACPGRRDLPSLPAKGRPPAARGSAVIPGDDLQRTTCNGRPALGLALAIYKAASPLRPPPAPFFASHAHSSPTSPLAPRPTPTGPPPAA